MRRPIAETLKQFTDKSLPQVNAYDHVLISQVLFPAHAFRVTASGYSGPSVVYADASIDFGTLLHPKVFRGNNCRIERDQRTGAWHATQYEVNLACAPTTNPNPPNVPLPVYAPKLSTSPFPPFPPLPPLPPFNPIPNPQPTPHPIPTGDWVSQIYFATATNGVYYSSNFTGPTGAMPTWSTLNTGLPVTALLDMRPDPFASGTRQYVLTNEAVSAGNYNRIYRRVAPGNWTQVLQPSDLRTLFSLGAGSNLYIVAFNTDINVAGRIDVAFRFGGGNLNIYYAYSTDYGATWNAGNGGASLILLTNGNCNNVQIGYFKGASPYPAGYVIYVPCYGTGARSLQVSVNKGTSFTQVRNDIEFEYSGLVKFAADSFQDVIYACSDIVFGLGNQGIWRSLDRGANWTRLLDCYPVPNPGSSGARYYALSCVYPGDGTRASTIRCITANDSGGNAPLSLSKTLDGGASWSTTALPTTDTDGDSIQPIGLSLVQTASNKLYFLTAGIYGGGATHEPHILVSTDDGVTMVNKAGTNWNTAPYTNAIPWNAGGPVGIIQVWN